MARSIPLLAVPAKPPERTVKESNMETERKEQWRSIEENGVGTPMLSGDVKTKEPQANRKIPKCSKNVFISVLLFLFLVSCFCNVYYLAGFKEVKCLPSVPGPANSTSCPQGWQQHEDLCYFFSETEGDWNSSQSYCTSFGGSLVMMDSQPELDYVMLSKRHEYCWIGLQREDDKHPWKLPDGSLFSNWFPIKGKGPCAYLREKTLSSTWCSNMRYGICRKTVEKR